MVTLVRLRQHEALCRAMWWHCGDRMAEEQGHPETVEALARALVVIARAWSEASHALRDQQEA
jgi:hypothetical protein